MNSQNDIHGKAAGIWNPAFVKISIVSMLVQSCFFMMNTLSPVYADSLGAPATIVGLVSGLFALTALVFRVVSGPAIDTFNRKYVLIGSMFVLVTSFVANIVSRTIPMLVFSRLLTGVGMSFMTASSFTMAADSLPNDRMGTGIGYFSLGTALGGAIAPTIGLKLVETVGYTPTFVILAAVMLLAISCAMTMKTSFTPVKPFTITLSSIIAKETLVPAVIFLLLAMTSHSLNAFLVLFSQQQGVTSNIGYFFTVSAISMLFTKLMIGKLADRYGVVKAVAPALLCFAAAFLLISYSRTLPMFLLAAFLTSFGFGGCHPALFALCMKSVPEERRGAASSTTFIGIDLGSLVGPVIAGVLAEGLGYANMWRSMMIPIFVAMLMTVLLRNKTGQAGKAAHGAG